MHLFVFATLQSEKLLQEASSLQREKEENMVLN